MDLEDRKGMIMFESKVPERHAAITTLTLTQAPNFTCHLGRGTRGGKIYLKVILIQEKIHYRTKPDGTSVDGKPSQIHAIQKS